LEVVVIIKKGSCFFLKIPDGLAQRQPIGHVEYF